MVNSISSEDVLILIGVQRKAKWEFKWSVIGHINSQEEFRRVNLIPSEKVLILVGVQLKGKFDFK